LRQERAGRFFVSRKEIGSDLVFKNIVLAVAVQQVRVGKN
jgi:hypothetical protein